MTIAELLYILALAFLGGVMSFLVCTTRRDVLGVVIFFQISFWFRTTFVGINAIMNFFTQKYSSDFSIGLMDQPGGLWSLFTGAKVFSTANLTNMKFFLESLINLPAIRLFEDSTIMLNYTNAFVGAIAGLVAFGYMRRLFDERIGTYSLLLVSLYPCALNFSFFAVRDIIIYLFLVINIFSFTWLILRRDYRLLNIVIYAISFFCATILRVTFLVFILILPGWFLLLWILRNFGRFRSLYERMFLAVTGGIIVMITAGVVLVGAYFVVLHQVGIGQLVAPDVLLQDYAAERATRGSNGSALYNPALGTGAFSLYLPLAMFNRLPFPARVGLQLVAFIIIPLPWQLTQVTRVLALSDSIFTICCMWWGWRLQRMLRGAARDGPPLPAVLRRYPLEKLRRLCFALWIAFVMSWFGFGILVSDSGNAFRMRISVDPFILFGASIYAAYAMRWLEVGIKRAVAGTRQLTLAPGE
jgi:hypothetical protein